jgi:hypothetical protein
VFSVRGPCREDIRECGNGSSSVARRRIEDLVCDVTCAVVH